MDRHCHSNTLGYSKSKMVDTTVVFQSLGREKKIKEIMKLIRHGAFGLIPHLISPDYAEGGGELSFQTSYTLRWPGEIQFLYVPNTDPTAYWTALVDQCSWRVEGVWSHTELAAVPSDLDVGTTVSVEAASTLTPRSLRDPAPHSGNREGLGYACPLLLFLNCTVN